MHWRAIIKPRQRRTARHPNMPRPRPRTRRHWIALSSTTYWMNFWVRRQPGLARSIAGLVQGRSSDRRARRLDDQLRNRRRETTVCLHFDLLRRSTRPSSHCTRACRLTSRSTREPGRLELTAGPPSTAIRPLSAPDILTTVRVIGIGRPIAIPVKDDIVVEN